MRSLQDSQYYLLLISVLPFFSSYLACLYIELFMHRSIHVMMKPSHEYFCTMLLLPLFHMLVSCMYVASFSHVHPYSVLMHPLAFCSFMSSLLASVNLCGHNPSVAAYLFFTQCFVMLATYLACFIPNVLLELILSIQHL